MTRSNTFRGLSTAVVAVALLVATTATGAREQTEAQSWSHQHRARPRRVGRRVKLVEGDSAARGEGSSRCCGAATAHITGRRRRAPCNRAIALVDGQLLLVAHSYGGVVITQAGNDPKVAGLVYVAAFAPLEGQSAFDLANAVSHTRPSGTPTGSIRILEAHADRNSGRLRPGPVRLRADRADRHSGSNCRWRLLECAGFHSRLADTSRVGL